MPANPATHPSADTLRALGLGKLDGAEAEAVLSHLGSCPDCCRKAADLPGDTFIDRLRDAHTRSEAPGRARPGGTEAPRGPEAVPPAAGPKTPWAPQEFPASFGRYRVLKLLGKGGMGAVYLAHDTQLDRPVALKVPHFEEAEGPQVLERFYREARAAATVLHPNICPLYDVGEINGTPYLTMAYVEGKPLEEFAALKPLTPKQAAFLVRKLALALAEAHKRGVIHRDLKPSNVMIDNRGEAMIMDFGLARRTRAGDPRLTQQGAFFGTPAYAPPEQVSGDIEATGPASDVYSLGVLLYELLAGRLPFTGDVLLMLSRVLLEEPPPPSQFRPDLPPALEAVCLKAMAKKVEDRYASMTELAAALADALRVKPPPPRPPVPAAEAKTEAEGIRVSQLGGLRSVANLHAQLPARKAGTDKPRRPRRKPAGRGRVPAWAWLLGAGVGLLLLVGLGAVIVFKLKTKDGTLVLEVNEPDAEVFVDGHKITVTWGDGGKKAEVRVKPGTHKVEVKKDGFMADGETVTLEDRGRRLFKARLERAWKAPPIAQDPAEGFVPLFNGKDLSGWEPVGTGQYQIENGTLRTLGKVGPGWLATERDYGDFELELEYRLGPKGNSGVFVRAWTGGDPGGGQFVEIQLYDDRAYGTAGKVTGTAAVFGVVAARPAVEAIPNTWHKLNVRAQGRRLQVSFDGRQVIDANLDEYPNLFQRFPGLKRASGRIGLQNTGTPVEFRNIRIKELSAGGGKVSKAPEGKVRNPFGVPDVPDPDGEDVREFAARAGLAGDDRDANAEQWVKGATAGTRTSLDGEWSDRWKGNVGDWRYGKGPTHVKAVGERAYVLINSSNGRFLMDLKREKNRLVGRFQGVDDPRDTGTCVFLVVDGERIDGTWGGLSSHRWDFRRKLK